MRSALTLAALASAAMALPVQPGVAGTETENILHRRHYASHHRHSHHKYHQDYVKADIAHALCETVNGLANLVRSSNIGDQLIPDGSIDCSKLPRSNKGKVCSSDHDHGHGNGQHHHHHGSQGHPHHEQHQGSHHHEHGHGHGHDGHDGHGHGHHHGGNPGYPGGDHHTPPPTSSPFTPLLTLSLGDNGLIDNLVGDKGVLRPVLGSLTDPLDGLSPDALKHAVESSTSPASGLPADTLDPAGNLVHAVNGNSGLVSDPLGAVTGATGQLLHVGVTDAGSSVADGIIGGSNLGGVPLHIGTPANPVTGGPALDSPVAGLVHAAIVNSGSALNPSELVDGVNGLPTDSLLNGVDAPLAGTMPVTGVPTGAGEILHAEAHDGDMITNSVTHDLPVPDGVGLANGLPSDNGVSLPNGLPPTNGVSATSPVEDAHAPVNGASVDGAPVTGATSPVGELLHAGVHNVNESTEPTINSGNFLTGNIPTASGNELVDDGHVPLIHAQAQAHGAAESPSNEGPVVNGANGGQILHAASQSLSGSGNASRASELLHAGVHDMSEDGPVINGLDNAHIHAGSNGQSNRVGL